MSKDIIDRNKVISLHDICEITGISENSLWRWRKIKGLNKHETIIPIGSGIRHIVMVDFEGFLTWAFTNNKLMPNLNKWLKDKDKHFKLIANKVRKKTKRARL